jgi:hypothetical protein
MYIYIKIGLVLFLFVHFAENSWSRSNYAFLLVENIHYSWCKKNTKFFLCGKYPLFFVESR